MYYHYFSENFFIEFGLKNTIIEFEENQLLLKHQDFKLRFKSAESFELNDWNFSFKPVTINHQAGFFLHGKKENKFIYAVSLYDTSSHYDEIIKEFDVQFPHLNLNKQFIKPDFKYLLIENETHFVLKIDKNDKVWSEGEMTLKLKIEPKLSKETIPLDNELINKIKLFAKNIVIN